MEKIPNKEFIEIIASKLGLSARQIYYKLFFLFFDWLEADPYMESYSSWVIVWYYLREAYSGSVVRKELYEKVLRVYKGVETREHLEVANRYFALFRSRYPGEYKFIEILQRRILRGLRKGDILPKGYLQRAEKLQSQAENPDV